MPDLIRSQDDFLGDLLRRIRKLEGNSVSVASPVVGASVPGGSGNFEVTNLLTIDNLQVFKDTGNVLLYANGHTTPTNVAVPTGDYINVFASKISPLDHVTVMTDPILFFDQGILIEKDVETFGAFMSASDPYKGFGGGAVMLGHGFENVNDPPRINMTDNGFHELAITAGSSLVGGVWNQTNLDTVLADVRLRVLTSKAPTGTPPLNVASTTKVTNLNADLLDGLHASEIIWNGGNATNNIICGNTSYNMYLEAAYPTLHFGDRSTTWDTLIYRYSAGVIGTNTVLMQGDCIVANAAWYNVYIEGLAPVIHFGNRASAWDTALARPSANVLCLNGAFEAYDPAGTHDTASYGLLGVTRTADNANNSYIVMTKQSTCVWGLGINNTNDLIIGYANSGKTITPRLTMTLDGNATLSGSLTIAGNFNISGEGHKTLAIPYDIVINTYMPSWGANATRPWILHGWNSTYDDFMSICATGNSSNVNKGAVVISQHGIFFGYGSNDGQSISTQWAKIDSSGNLTVAGSIGDSNGAVWCASINFNGGGQSGFPIFGRNTISSVKVVECTGDMVIDGNMTVGTVAGGLSVTGTIASTGSYFQIGAAGSGAMRLAKTSPGVFSVQSYNGTSWLLGTLNAGIIFVDLINSATAGGIFVGDHLRLYSGSAAVKLYDSTNAAPANYFLSTNSSGYPVWVPSTSTWNGGTVANNITISKTQPYIDYYYAGVREWKVGMVDSGSATFSIIEQSGIKGLNIDGNGLVTIFGNLTSQGYIQTTLNSQILPATTNGMYMFWNFSGGNAEGDFFNTYEITNTVGYGGFRWYQKLTSSTSLCIASLDCTGNFSVSSTYKIAGTIVTGRFSSTSTYIGAGDGGYFYDDGSVYLGKSDASKSVNVRGFLAVSGAIKIGSTTKLYNSESRILQVQDENGALATLDASNVFTDHLNSASGGGIYIMDVLRAYSNGYITFYDDLYAHGTFLTYGWQNHANTSFSEISDDVANYFGLMLVGNSSGGGGVRRVKVWDELTVNGLEIVTGNNQVNGTIYCGNDIYVGTSVANDAHIHRANVGVLQVLDANGALATWEASNIKADHWTASTGSEMYFMNHLRAYSALNIMPNANNSGNIGGNGAGTNYYWGAVYANYLEYKTSHGAFDALDDLSLVKNYKVKTISNKGVDQEIIDDESLFFLKNEEGFFEASRSVGFLLGCAKFSALKQDELEQRIVNLEEQLMKLKGGA